MKYLDRIPIVLLALVLWACHKEVSYENNKPGTTPVVKTVETSIQGRVLDEDRAPVQGAVVSAGGRSVQTDVNGVFLLQNVTVNENAAAVTVKKAGYFTGTRTLVASANNLHYMQVQLLPLREAATFDAATGGAVQLPSCTLVFLPGQVLKQDNKPYKGSVSIRFAHLNPESENFADIMPGDLRGTDRNNNMVGLQSFGMIAVELQGSGGEVLRLDTTKMVMLKMTIPATLAAAAPAQIPLWYFDEASGLWKEEGSATRAGNEYIGGVRHFSFWNCDMSFPLVNFKAVVTNQQNVPVPNMQVSIVNKANNAVGYGYTSANGAIQGMVPANAPLAISLTDHCGHVLLVKDIGPFSKHTDYGAIRVTLPAANNLAINGEVADCNNAPVQNGVVNITLDGLRYAAAINKGIFEITIPRCNPAPANAVFSVFDADTKVLAETTLSVTTGPFSPKLAACGKVADDFINVVIDGTPLVFTSPVDTFYFSAQPGWSGSDSTILLSAKSKGGMNYLSIQFRTLTPGIQSPVNFSYFSRNLPQQASDRRGIRVTITGSAQGRPLEGTLSGTTKDTLGKEIQVNGAFSVKRQ